jgi:hypothetical protein
MGLRPGIKLPIKGAEDHDPEAQKASEPT